MKDEEKQERGVRGEGSANLEHKARHFVYYISEGVAVDA